MNNQKIAIISVGCFSKFGITPKQFCKNIQISSQKTSKQSVDYVDFTNPENYDIETILGNENLRSLDETTEMTAVCVKRCIDQITNYNDIPDSEIGIIVGTNTGNLSSTIEFIMDSYTGEKGYMVKPYLLPRAILNYSAGNSAIRFGLKGANITGSGGNYTGFTLLNYAAKLLETERAKLIFVGATEEDSVYSRWFHKNNRSDYSTNPVHHGKGSIFFSVEKHEDAIKQGHNVLCELIDLNIDYCATSLNIREQLEKAINNIIEKNKIEKKQIKNISIYNNYSSKCRGDEIGVINKIFNIEKINIVCVSDIIGETYAVSNFFQLLSILCDFQSNEDYALITYIDNDRMIGCGLIKK